MKTRLRASGTTAVADSAEPIPVASSRHPSGGVAGSAHIHSDKSPSGKVTALKEANISASIASHSNNKDLISVSARPDSPSRIIASDNSTKPDCDITNCREKSTTDQKCNSSDRIKAKNQNVDVGTVNSCKDDRKRTETPVNELLKTGSFSTDTSESRINGSASRIGLVKTNRESRQTSHDNCTVRTGGPRPTGDISIASKNTNNLGSDVSKPSNCISVNSSDGSDASGRRMVTTKVYKGASKVSRDDLTVSNDVSKVCRDVSKMDSGASHDNSDSSKVSHDNSKVNNGPPKAINNSSEISSGASKDGSVGRDARDENSDSVVLTEVATVNKTFPCVLCSEKLASKSELQDHFRRHGQNGSSQPKTRRNLVSTTVNSRVTKLISCDVCEEIFENVTLAIHHKYKQHPHCQKRSHCGFCGKQFPLEVCKQIHIEAEHKNVKKSQQLYRCRECLADFFSLSAVNFHVQSSHRRVSAILSPVTTLPPSKKIKLNTEGEPYSVYYCHLCGMEYMLKFNLQKHLEHFHTTEQRNASPEQLVKCKLCDAMFYNKKAYESHNFHHKPADLYLESEQDRKAAVPRIDQDFDLSRVPSIWQKYEGKRKRIQPLGESSGRTIESPTPSSPSSSSTSASTPFTTSTSTSSSTSTSTSLSTSTSNSISPSTFNSTAHNAHSHKAVGRKNRALVGSDSELKSDTSDESDDEGIKTPQKKKTNWRKKVLIVAENGAT